MRVLHVNKFLYRRGGAEAYMLDTALLQREAGHQVAFFGMQHPENSPDERYAAHFPPFVQLEPAPAGLRPRTSAVARMMWSPSSRRGMNEVIRSFRPDVVHLHNIYHHLSPSVLRPLERHGVPAVMTLHDYKLICPSYLMLDHGKVCDACLGGRYLNAVRRRCKNDSRAASAVLAIEAYAHHLIRAYAAVQVFLCPSRFLASQMALGGAYPDRLAVLPNFVDAAAIPAKESPGGDIVYAGRLSQEKGVDVLIDAVGRLGDRRLHIAGEGPRRVQLDQLADQRAPGRVRFHGRLPKERLLELMRSAAVTVLPSRSHENQPMAVLESFACGVPVVASRLGGLPELVGEGRHGHTVPPGDPDALAAALALLLGDPAGTFATGRAARAYVEQVHSPEGHLRRLEEMYARAQRLVCA